MEIWLPIAGIENYEVSSLGRVRRVTCRILRGNLRSSSRSKTYKSRHVGVIKDGKLTIINVAHLVCTAFNSPRPVGSYCLHKNGDSLDNRPENLMWGTQKQNMEHASQHGTKKNPPRITGPNHYMAKLTTKQVEYIKAQPKKNGLHVELAHKFNVTPSAISKIRALINRVEG